MYTNESRLLSFLSGFYEQPSEKVKKNKCQIELTFPCYPESVHVEAAAWVSYLKVLIGKPLCLNMLSCLHCCIKYTILRNVRMHFSILADDMITHCSSGCLRHSLKPVVHICAQLQTFVNLFFVNKCTLKLLKMVSSSTPTVV